MTKSALINALDKRNAKLSASSNGGDQAVDEAFESLFGTIPATSSKTRSTAKIPLKQLHPFFTSNIGFKPYSGEDLKALAEDILENGLIENIKVRPCKTGGYEILRGHNRVNACKMLGCAEIPADIEYVDDARAIVIATVTNLQRRQNLLPSERGWAYRALLDAYRQQGKRNDLVEATCGEFHPKLGARERVACFFDVGVNDVRQTVRLTYLIPPLLNAVDERKLNMMCGVAISYYDEATQKLFQKRLNEENCRISVAVMKHIKKNCPPPFITAAELDKVWHQVTAAQTEKKTGNISFSRRRFEPYLHRIPPDMNLEDLFLEFLENRFAESNGMKSSR